MKFQSNKIPNSHFIIRSQKHILSLLLAVFLSTLVLLLAPANQALAACGGNTLVANEADLNAAITDFNSQPGPCSYMITLTGNILLGASTAAIININAGTDLLINGAGFVVNGQNKPDVRPFEVSAGTTVEFANINITGGNVTSGSGGGLINHGITTIRDSAVFGNQAFAGGGGLENQDGSSQLTVIDSEIYENTARNAGAVRNQYGGTVSITGSIIRDNHKTTGSRGAIWSVSGGNVTISNSCIVGNDDTAVVDVTSATNNWWGTASGPSGAGPGNGDSISGGVPFNPILTTAPAGCPSYPTEIAVSGLGQDISSGDMVPSSVDGSDFGITSVGVALPDRTFEVANLGGADLVLGGSPRVALSGPGAGAFNVTLQPGSLVASISSTSFTIAFSPAAVGQFDATVTITNNDSDENPFTFAIAATVCPSSASNEGELNAAIACYNTITAADTHTINLTAGINLSTSTTPIDNDNPGVNLLLDGQNFIINGQNISGVRPFEIKADTVVELRDINITGGNMNTPSDINRSGGGVRNFGDLTIRDSAVYGNVSFSGGGGIENQSPTAVLSLISSEVYNNLARNGGGLRNTDAATMIIEDSIIRNNETQVMDGSYGSGAGIWNIRGGQLSVNNSQIMDNTAEGSGGGIQSKFSEIGTPAAVAAVVTNSQITGNSAADGGGFSLEDGTASISNTCIVFNSDTAVTGAVNAAGNWWGAADGPSGTAPGSGDSVGAAAGTSGFLTTPPAGCPSYNTHLTLVKQVINNDGGSASPTAWLLSASGPTPLSGYGGADGDVDPGTYTLSESGGPAGYTAGPWSCSGGSQTSSMVTLGIGQTTVCTIINDDTLLNQPPTANANGPYLVAVNGQVTFDGSSSSDPDGDPLTESWTAGGGTVVGNMYTAGAVPGVYDVQLIVNDSHKDSLPDKTIVVVYDPDGGFVTGGGWIESPVDAYKANPSLTGKANFGFVAKYKKGANVPDGNAQFQFKTGDLNFHSTHYEWLVVAGSEANFKGEGTINGQGSYQFKISACDDNPNTFRIRIWGDTGIVYDNGSNQPLSGGSIKVHK